MESEYKIDELLVFARENIRLFDEKYEMFLTKPEDLIGKKVVSIRSGFSNSGGGQVMLVEKIETYKEGGELQVKLIPCEESSLNARDRESHRGWGCRFAERSSSFVFYKPELGKIIDRL